MMIPAGEAEIGAGATVTDSDDTGVADAEPENAITAATATPGIAHASRRERMKDMGGLPSWGWMSSVPLRNAEPLFLIPR